MEIKYKPLDEGRVMSRVITTLLQKHWKVSQVNFPFSKLLGVLVDDVEGESGRKYRLLAWNDSSHPTTLMCSARLDDDSDVLGVGGDDDNGPLAHVVGISDARGRCVVANVRCGENDRSRPCSFSA